MENPCRICSHTPTQLDLLQERSLQEPLHYSNSTIPDLLKSNDPPCETKSKEIQASIAEQNGKLAEIDAKMARVQQQLADLFAERTRVQQKILDCKAIFHPIRRVPGDVLDEIFTRLINEDVSEDEETCSYDPKALIWSLPHVSRQWRNSALSFPRLWSTVRVNLSSGTSVAPAHAAFILGVQLQRSDPHPLSVSIYSKDDKISWTNPIFQVLFPTSHRWKNLHLNLHIQLFDTFRPLTISFPLLRCLHLYTNPPAGDVDRIARSPLSIMFQFCPNLEELYGHPRYYSAMKIPFSQIRTLDGSLSYANSDICLELTCFPNLYHLSLSPDDKDETGVNHPEVTLSCLSSLALWRVKAGPIHLFKYLRSPSLNRLDIARLDRVCDLVPFLQRSNSLTSLSIKSVSFTDKDFIQILEATPSLTYLMFDCPLTCTDEFVNRLIGDDDTPRLVPSLAILDARGDARFKENQAPKLREARPDLKLVNFDEV